VQIVNAGDSEFKAGEIVEQDKVEDLNEELKRRKVVYEPYCFYLSAWEEDKYVVAQANVSLDDRLKITTELVNCRQPATSCSRAATKWITSTFRRSSSFPSPPA